MTDHRDRVDAGKASPLSGMAVTIVATLCALYIVSQFLRNSIGVLAPDIAAEVVLSPLQIGLLSSVYFFVFAATQLPLGLALDRFGPRRCIAASVGFTVVGCVVFAIGQSAMGLVAGRALLGLGTASFLMAPVALYARWFAPSMFSTMAGIHLGIGSLGALLATAPLAWAAASFGWRVCFLGVALATVLIGVLALVVVRDDPPGVTRVRQPESFRESVAGIWQVMRTPSMGRVFLAQLASYPSFLLVIGLWGGPYLTHIYGYGLTGRGEILFVAALAQIAGSFFWGPTDRLFGAYRPPVLLATAGCFTALATLAIIGILPLWLLLAVFVLMGFTTGVSSVVMAHGRSLVAPHLLGRCITLLNIGTMGGGFVVQFISGIVIDLFPAVDGVYPLAAYQLVFALQAGLVLVAGIVYWGSRETYYLR